MIRARRHVPATALLAALVLVAGCSAQKRPERRAEQDPAVSGALGEQLMTDPDLARINLQNRAISGGGSAAAPIPLEDRSTGAIARARADAAALLGRAAAGAPPTGPVGPGLARETPALAAVAALGPAANACAGKLEPGFAWAARVSPALPIYPRGHVQEAAGTDRDGCALRVVNYVTPVPADELAAFYWALAGRMGPGRQSRLAGADRVIAGRRGTGQGVVMIAARDDGLTEVDLVTSGL